MTDAPWGEVPDSMRVLINALRGSVARHSEELENIAWPAGPGDFSPQLLRTLSETEAVMQAAKDLRSLLTAYAHKVHQPRPKMADIAQAQNASPQAVTGRYSASTLGAIEGALRVGRGEPAEADDGGPVGPPDFSAALRHAFPSLTEMLEADGGHSNLEEWFRTRLSAVEKHEL